MSTSNSSDAKITRRKYLKYAVGAGVGAAAVATLGYGFLQPSKPSLPATPTRITTSAQQTTPTLQPIRIGVPAAPPGYGPQLVAREKGFFREEGLEPVIKIIQGGTLTTNALIAGEIDVGVGIFTEVAKTVAKNQPLVWIYTMQHRNDWSIMVRSDVAAKAGVNVNSPLQDRFNALKGLVFASLPAGGDIDAATRYVAVKGGLDPERDIKFVYMAGIPLMKAAFKEGQVQAYGLARSNSFDFVKDGIGVELIANTPTRNDLPEYRNIIYAGAYVMKNTADTKQDLLRRYARVMYKASQFIEDNPKEYGEILVMEKLVGSEVRDQAVASLIWMNDRTGYTAVENVKNLLEVGRIGERYTTQEYNFLVEKVNTLYTNQFLPNPNPP